jgi:hypothetical protein
MREWEVRMAVQSITWGWDWVFGGSNGYTASNQWNFAPVNAMFQTSLSVGSPGLGIIGVSQYVTRQSNGADEFHNVPAVYVDGGIICYPPVVYDPALCGVTWLLMCGGGLDQMAGSALMFSFE